MEYTVIEDYAYIDIKTVHYNTIQEFFDGLIPSKKYQHLLIQNKWIMIDEKPVQRETPIVGKTLKIILYPESYYYEVRNNKNVDIVYEDELVMVVNKPSGMLVHSDGNHNKTTVTDILEGYFKRNNVLGSINPIHRLDEETQGLLLISKSPIFQGLLDKLLSYKQISRHYLAFVQGRVDKGSRITIEEPIGKDRHNAKKRVVAKNGQQAKTIVESIYTNNEYSVLKCDLKTGRTHQIRVHLAYIGHPILNDELYGNPSKLTEHMGLVANELTFYHPLKEEMITVKGDITSDLQKLIK